MAGAVDDMTDRPETLTGDEYAALPPDERVFYNGIGGVFRLTGNPVISPWLYRQLSPELQGEFLWDATSMRYIYRPKGET